MSGPLKTYARRLAAKFAQLAKPARRANFAEFPTPIEYEMVRDGDSHYFAPKVLCGRSLRGHDPHDSLRIGQPGVRA